MQAEESFGELASMADVLRNSNLNLKMHYDESNKPVTELQHEFEYLRDELE